MTKKRGFAFNLLVGLFIAIFCFNGLGISDNFKKSVTYAHMFTPNDFASFIATVDQFQIESQLVKSSMENSNMTLAKAHAEKGSKIYFQSLAIEAAERDEKMAQELTKAVRALQNMTSNQNTLPTNTTEGSGMNIDPQQQEQVSQLVGNIDSYSNDMIKMTMDQQNPQQGSNPFDAFIGLVSGIFGGGQQESTGNTDPSRIPPLRFADLMDGILENYGRAFNVGFDMTNMSNMALMMNNPSNISDGSNSDSSSGSDGGNNNDAMDHMMGMGNMNMGSHPNGAVANNSLTSVADYQSAVYMAEKAQAIFDSELKPLFSSSSNSNSTASIETLEKALGSLDRSIKDKASPMDVMMIVHSQIHPSLLTAFNMELKVNP